MSHSSPIFLRFVRILLAVLLSASLPAAKAQKAGRVDGKEYDLVVYGSTPGGIACAVRAAREGLNVLMVTHAQHVGGLFSNGLSTMDTLYSGSRAPLYDEFRKAILDYYRETYGEDSPQYEMPRSRGAKTTYEASVAERLMEKMISKESRITLVKGYYPISSERQDRLMRAATFQQKHGQDTFSVSGKAFADCSYEADLAAVAKVPYRVGREAREQFKEKHAGVIYMETVKWPPPNAPASVAEHRKLDLVGYKAWQEIIFPASTGAADPSVQAYNLRTVLTINPDNRIIPGQPADYDREELKRRLDSDVRWNMKAPQLIIPNQKAYWNYPELIGVQNAYVEGDWATREKVADDHRKITLALLYYLQNDSSVPEHVRAQWREYGLPKDEFPDNGNMPYEIYMRETRRIAGRYVFTENDGTPVQGIKRAPIHPDAISITEWFFDSHACTPRKVEDSLWEGEILLKNKTFPGQIPWRTLLPEDYDNFLVPVCLSASHVGWGAIRLEPTWMSLGEAAALAVTTAMRQKIQPAEVDSDQLVRLLADRKIMLSFFNDIKKHAQAPWYSAVQYLGTQGYFGSYDAKPQEHLATHLADAWIAHAIRRVKKNAPLTSEEITKNWEAEQAGGDPVKTGKFCQKLFASLGLDAPAEVNALLDQLQLDAKALLSRGDACRIITAATKR